MAHITPENIKDDFLEWSNLGYKDTIGFCPSAHNENYEKLDSMENFVSMSVLDADAIAGNRVAGPDQYNLEVPLIDWKKEIDREKSLTIKLGQAIKNPLLKQQVEDLIVKDLEADGVHEEKWKGRHFLKKAGVLSDHRYREALEVDTNKCPQTTDFIVYLNCLYLGFAEHVDLTKCHFSYDVTFDKFLEILQTQTSACTIPPKPIVRSDWWNLPSLDSSSDVYPSPDSVAEPITPGDTPLSQPSFLESSNSDYSNQFVERAYSPPEAQRIHTQVSKAKKLKGSKNETLPKGPAVDPNIPMLPLQKRPGYTHLDGPWEYKLIFTSDGAGVPKRYRLATHSDYKEMQRCLKDSDEKGPKKVFIMHSLDWKAVDDFNAERKVQIEARDNFRYELKDALSPQNRSTSHESPMHTYEYGSELMDLDVVTWGETVLECWDRHTKEAKATRAASSLTPTPPGN